LVYLQTVTQKPLSWFLEHKEDVKKRELQREGEG
jgi:hypothetical protein